VQAQAVTRSNVKVMPGMRVIVRHIEVLHGSRMLVHCRYWMVQSMCAPFNYAQYDCSRSVRVGA
jgi:hypothetical protein